jgi:sensor histidine kinase regulating citrate/malate metabolism
MKTNKLSGLEEDTIYNSECSMDIIQYLREQRHNFMNDIQVIWGYLQMGSPEKAAGFIRELNERHDTTGRILRLGEPAISLFLYNQVLKSYKLGITVDFEMEAESLESMECGLGGKDLKAAGESFDKLLEVTASLGEKAKIYMDIYEADGIVKLTISNNLTGSCEDGCLSLNIGLKCWKL